MCIFSLHRNNKAKDSSEFSSSRDIDTALAMSDEPTSRKQEISLGVANRLLEHLILRGYSIHPHLLTATAIKRLMGIMGLPTYSHAMLVHELCREFRLDSVEYEVLADPAGQPDSVTVKVRIGHVERVATARNKEIAHKLAAEQMYKYLRTMLKGSRGFDEEDAMFRAYKRCLNEFDEEVAAALEEKQRKDQEQEAAAKRKQAWLGEKHTQSLAVQATILLELEESEDSEESKGGLEPVATSSNVRTPSPTPGPSSAPDQYDNNLIAEDGVVKPAAIQLLLRTMEQLGI